MARLGFESWRLVLFARGPVILGKYLLGLVVGSTCGRSGKADLYGQLPPDLEAIVGERV